MSLVDRLADRMTINNNGCFLWNGRLDKEGYGEIKIQGNRKRVHRIAYEELVGPIPEGMDCHHIFECGNRNCFNPDHIEFLTTVEHAKVHNPLQPSCGRGHAFTAENTRVRSDGRRECRACERYRRNPLGNPRSTPFKKGSEHHKAVLNEEQVIGVMARLLTGKESHREIARTLGVSRHAVDAIWNGETWGHLFLLLNLTRKLDHSMSDVLTPSI